MWFTVSILWSSFYLFNQVLCLFARWFLYGKTQKILARLVLQTYICIRFEGVFCYIHCLFNVLRFDNGADEVQREATLMDDEGQVHAPKYAHLQRFCRVTLPLLM
jgi:hypothetical protein